MLLFSDGFEYFHPKDLYRKWGYEWNVDGSCNIVFGEDDEFDPPNNKYARKDGKALQFINGFTSLSRFVKKSRTLFLGFAHRYKSGPSTIKIYFHSRNYPYSYPIPRVNRDYDYHIFPEDHNTVAICTFTFRDDYIDYTWNFNDAEVPTQYNQVFSHKSLLDGDWSYHEIGMTIHGNLESGAQAWIENRIGKNNGNRLENIYTADPLGVNCYFLDGISIHLPEVSSSINTSFDDVYICNDEGNVNNGFLGPVIIRSTYPVTQGQDNESTLYNTEGSDPIDAIQAEYVNTHDSLPTPLPTPEEDPLFIEWEDPTIKHLTLPTEGNKQSFRVRNVYFHGSEPNIYGLILHGLFRPQHDTIGNTSIKPYIHNAEKDITLEGYAHFRPLKKYWNDEWEARELIFENQEIEQSKLGFLPDVFNTLDVNEFNEYGIELTSIEADFESFNPTVLRNKYTFDIELTEEFTFQDIPMRFWEEQIALSFSFEEAIEGHRTFALYDNLQINEEYTQAARGRSHYVNSVLEIAVNIPWYILYLHENICFADTLNLDWIETISQEMNFIDTAYGFWVELINAGFDVADVAALARSLGITDYFNINDSGVGTNHELIIDGFAIQETYVWSNHEWIGETLYPEDNEVILAWNIPPIEDFFVLTEEHFDGFWVQFFEQQFSVNDHILTQQWRHDFFAGICLDSWQVEPIEQEGDDGDRTGQITAEYWENLGYEEPPDLEDLE